MAAISSDDSTWCCISSSRAAIFFESSWVRLVWRDLSVAWVRSTWAAWATKPENGLMEVIPQSVLSVKIGVGLQKVGPITVQHGPQAGRLNNFRIGCSR